MEVVAPSLIVAPGATRPARARLAKERLPLVSREVDRWLEAGIRSARRRRRDAPRARCALLVHPSRGWLWPGGEATSLADRSRPHLARHRGAGWLLPAYVTYDELARGGRDAGRIWSGRRRCPSFPSALRAPRRRVCLVGSSSLSLVPGRVDHRRGGASVTSAV
jgi:hypothetical protein